VNAQTFVVTRALDVNRTHLLMSVAAN
jgi:hypothetical protein